MVPELLSCDLRALIKLEEEFSQQRHFHRIFPNHEPGRKATTSEKYFPYMEKVTYYDQLVAAWEDKFAENRYEGFGLRNSVKTMPFSRSQGIQVLQELCQKDLHLT